MSLAVLIVALLSLSLCRLLHIFGQQVTPSPSEGPASLPTVDSLSGPFPTFDFSSSLASVLSTYNIPGGVVSLISLPTSPAQSKLASSLLSPPPLCPFLVNGLSAAGVRRSNSVVAVNVSDSFHHGSNTKAMTALLVNQQVERGRLQWNQTLASVFPYLPWNDGTPYTPSAGYFANSTYAAATSIDTSWHTVSIQQLLTHTSGINPTAPQYGSFFDQVSAIERAMDPIALRRINCSSTATYPVPSRQYFLQQMLSRAVPYPSASVDQPSSLGYFYANYNHMLLGCVVEELEGRAWEHIIGDLFTQLGMLSAGFGPPEIDLYNSQAAPQQPWPHYYQNQAWQPIGLRSPYNAIDNPEALGPAGTVHANLVDWARLTACHLLEGAGESNTTADPAPLLLHPSTWAMVHRPFVWPDTGSVATNYLLSGYGYAPAFPMGWGDAQLSHDGSNTEWYSRSALYLHGGQPFAVLAAFNAAPSSASNAMSALFSAVTGCYTRWLDSQRQSTSSQLCNTSSATSTNTTNSPLSTSYRAQWSVDTVYFTPIMLTQTSLLSSMSVYPAPNNAATGTYTAVLALYSQDGVLLGQTSAVSFSASQYNGQSLLPLQASFTPPLYLLNGTYYASLWYTHTSSADLLVYAYPTLNIYWVTPSATFSSVGGNLSSVDVADLLYRAVRWSVAALVQLTSYSATCGSGSGGPTPSSSAASLPYASSSLPLSSSAPATSSASKSASSSASSSFLTPRASTAVSSSASSSTCSSSAAPSSSSSTSSTHAGATTSALSSSSSYSATTSTSAGRQSAINGVPGKLTGPTLWSWSVAAALLGAAFAAAV